MIPVHTSVIIATLSSYRPVVLNPPVSILLCPRLGHISSTSVCSQVCDFYPQWV